MTIRIRRKGSKSIPPRRPSSELLQEFSDAFDRAFPLPERRELYRIGEWVETNWMERDHAHYTRFFNRGIYSSFTDTEENTKYAIKILKLIAEEKEQKND